MRACVSEFSACGIDLYYGFNLPPCIQHWDDVLRDPKLAAIHNTTVDRINCLAKAGADCDAARRCISVGSVVACGPTQDSPPPCDGDVVKTCDYNLKALNSLDCSSVGLQCIVELGAETSVYSCGIDGCSAGQQSCLNERVVLSCSSQHALEPSAVCPLDSPCQRHSDGTFGCTAPGAACTLSQSRCEGDVLVQCIDKAESRTDCAATGLRCIPPVGSNWAQCGLAEQCDALGFTPRCDGDGLLVCYLGLIDRFDCRSAGFSSCKQDHCAN